MVQVFPVALAQIPAQCVVEPGEGDALTVTCVPGVYVGDPPVDWPKATE